jgi:hypothetical protein
MSDLKETRKREMQRAIEEDLEEDLLRCPKCGQRDCLGLCEDIHELGLEMSAQDDAEDRLPMSTSAGPAFWLTDEWQWPPGR